MTAFLCFVILALASCNAYVTDNNNNIRRLPADIQPTSYKIRIHPYFDAPGVIFDPERNQTFDGEVSINATVVKPTSTIILNAKNLTIPCSNDNIVLSLTDMKPIKISNFFLTDENHTITIELERELKKDENIEIKLKYTGGIGHNKESGLFKSATKDGKGDHVYVTHLQTTKARHVFPSFDEPDYKATFEMIIVKPKAWVALSNTMNVSTNDIGNGYEEVVFERTEIMSSYLVAFGIGDLIKEEGYTADGILTRVWSLPSEEGKIKAALDSAIKCTDAMTKYTNFKLPLKKIDHLMVPYFSGGMENFGLNIYGDHVILFDPKTHDLQKWISLTKFVCHEIAHQWFGDIVTNKWWGDIFLHEGLANFLENKAVELSYPEEKELLDYQISKTFRIWFNHYMNFNSTLQKLIHPIITENGSFNVFITYIKSGAVIRQLEAVITPDVFQKGLQNYIQKYQFSNANYQQLLDEIQAAVDETRLKDWCGEPFNVTSFMNLWLNQKGHPNLHIDYTDGYFTIIQNVQNGTNEKLWPVPVFTQLANNKQRLNWSAPGCVCKTGTILPPTIQIGPPIHFINRDHLGVAQFIYTQNAAEAIVDALTSSSSNLQLSPASLVSFIFDVFESLKTSGVSNEHLRNITERVLLHQRSAFSYGIFDQFKGLLDGWNEEGKFDNVYYNLKNNITL